MSLKQITKFEKSYQDFYKLLEKYCICGLIYLPTLNQKELYYIFNANENFEFLLDDKNMRIYKEIIINQIEQLCFINDDKFYYPRISFGFRSLKPYKKYVEKYILDIFDDLLLWFINETNPKDKLLMEEELGVKIKFVLSIGFDDSLVNLNIEKDIDDKRKKWASKFSEIKNYSNFSFAILSNYIKELNNFPPNDKIELLKIREKLLSFIENRILKQSSFVLSKIDNLNYCNINNIFIDTSIKILKNENYNYNNLIENTQYILDYWIFKFSENNQIVDETISNMVKVSLPILS